MVKIFKLWGPVVVWMMVIFAFSSRQKVSVSEEFILNFAFFKTLHVIEYGILFLLSYRASHNSWWAFLITILYAVSDEIHQQFVPTREGAARDVIIDGFGALLSWYLINKLLPKAPKKLKNWARSWQII